MAQQDALAETFARFSAGLPPRERALRGSQFAQFLQHGFPGRREEAWRHTDLGTLNDRSFVLADGVPVDARISPIEDTDRLVYIDGRLDAAQSTVAELSMHIEPASAVEGADAIASLNAAFAADGLRLVLPERCQRTRVLHLVLAGNASGPAAMNHQRHRITLADDAQAAVIIELVGLRDGDRFSTQVFDMALGRNARLDLYRVQRESAGTTLLVQINARLAEGSQLNAVCIDSGYGLTRQDLNVALTGPGAETRLQGLYAANSGAHIDNHARVVHAAPRCRSRAHFRGIVHERARAILNGKVVVEVGAQKTDSELRIATLLLSRHSEVNAKPDLEIYADDVKCAHGLTVGQLDESALEYLRSRGLTETEARALLLRGFAAAALDGIAFRPLRHHIETAMDFPRDASDVAMEELAGIEGTSGSGDDAA